MDLLNIKSVMAHAIIQCLSTLSSIREIFLTISVNPLTELNITHVRYAPLGILGMKCSGVINDVFLKLSTWALYKMLVYNTYFVNILDFINIIFLCLAKNKPHVSGENTQFLINISNKLKISNMISHVFRDKKELINSI